MKEKKQYVSNERLLAELTVYIQSYNEAKAEGKRLPEIPDYVVTSFYKIGENMVTLAQFKGYSYKEDMIADGVENAIRYVRCFDPTRFNKPFAYFTRFMYNSFLRRIASEKKFQNVKNVVLIDNVINNPGNLGNTITKDDIARITTAIENYDRSQTRKRKK